MIGDLQEWHFNQRVKLLIDFDKQASFLTELITFFSWVQSYSEYHFNQNDTQTLGLIAIRMVCLNVFLKRWDLWIMLEAHL